MTDEGDVHAGGAIQRFLERKQHEHLPNQASDGPDPARPPGPDLRTDEITHGDAEAVSRAGEQEIEVRKIDTDQQGGAGRCKMGAERQECSPEGSPLFPQLGDAHHRRFTGIGQETDAGRPHPGPAHPGEREAGLPLAQGLDQSGAVQIAGRLSGHDRDPDRRGCQRLPIRYHSAVPC